MPRDTASLSAIRPLRGEPPPLTGPAAGVLLETYAHLIEEYAEAERIDAEHEIVSARQQQMFGESSATTSTGSETA